MGKTSLLIKLYEDETCIVFDKPSVLPVQGGNGITTSLDSIVTKEYKTRPLLVHRLDKDTSGVILLAKTPPDAAYYTKVFFQKEAIKTYKAICYAQDEQFNMQLNTQGTFSSPVEVKGVKKDALTFYKIIKANNNFLLFELTLGTGRMHQIRKQLAENKYPVLGDDKYGDFKLNKKLRKLAGVKKLMLHSEHLCLTNPKGQLLDVFAPLPAYFNDFLSRFFL